MPREEWLDFIETILVYKLGAINSDAGVQGLPYDGVCRQGKPCTPSVFSNAARFLCITFSYPT